MTEYQLTPAKYHHVQVVVSLNRVHLDNYQTPDAALKQLLELGYNPELRYQWNPERNEFDLYALIHDLPLAESLMTDEKCQEFFQHFKHSQIYSIGCGNADQIGYLLGILMTPAVTLNQKKLNLCPQIQ
jgi:hypothetical protein